MKNDSCSVKVIRVLIIHEDRLCREGIQQICARARNILVVGNLADVQAAVTMSASLTPDVVVINAGGNWIDTMDAIQGLLAQQPSVRILLITRQLHDPLIAHLRNLGVAGCISKNTSPQELLEAIREVAQGKPFPKTELEVVSVPSHAQMYGLTSGETLVLSLLAHGATNRTIARQLKLSEQTVANRLQVVYEKLGVNSRVQATLLALKHGWVSLDM